jgi:NAD(P)-dependent dehydrogenase (short-subunit alcohol dehydrogenase family)
MKTFLFIGANADLAIEARKLIENKGDKVIAISRNSNDFYPDFLIGNAVTNELPEITEALDGLVYFPGTINLKPFRSLKSTDFQQDFEINVLGAIHAIQFYAKQLKEGSSIVLFSTVAVQTGMPFHSTVSVAKGAVEGLTRALAAEFAPKIRVNCIAPSLTQTKLAGRLLNSEEKIEAMANKHPLKKIGSPKDLANALEFLLSDNSSWVTGQILAVDGGMSRLKI